MNEYSGDDGLTERDLNLIAIIKKNDPELIENWVRAGGVISEKIGVFSCSFLHVASYKGRESIIKVLIDLGIDVNVRDDLGKTPLMDAAHCGRITTMKLLMKFDSDINVQDNFGRAALHWASVMADRLEVVEYLVRSGANACLRTERGQTPYDYAISLGRTLTAKFLGHLDH